MFKNAIAYLVEPGFRIDPDMLLRRPARECGPADSRTDGFAAPCDHSTAELVHHVAGHQLICLQTEDRLLPGAYVEEVLHERAADIEAEQGYKPGRKQMKELKERVIEELLPKAFPVKKRTFALLTGKYLIVDTSSPARADLLIGALRVALDTLPLHLIKTEQHVTVAMADWLVTGEAPYHLTIDQDCVLEGREESKPSIRYQRTSLDSDDVRQRVANGHLPKKLSLTYRDRLSFHLTEALHLNRLQALDALMTERREADAENMAELFDADITIMAGTVVELLDYLIEKLGGIAREPNEDDLLAQASDVADAAKRLGDTLREDGATAILTMPGGESITFGSGEDPMYSEAVGIVISTQRASISTIQRHLRIGYNRAARLIEAMEKDGVVSAMDGRGERKVLKKGEKAA